MKNNPLFKQDFAPLERALRREKRLGKGAAVMTPERMVVELKLTTILDVRRLERKSGMTMPGLHNAVRVLRRHRLLAFNPSNAQARWTQWLAIYAKRRAEISNGR